MHYSTLVWVSATLTLLAVIYLIYTLTNDKRKLQNSLFAQRELVQLTKLEAGSQKKILEDCERQNGLIKKEYADYKTASEVNLRAAQSQRDAHTGQSRDLSITNSRQREQLISLNKQLTNALTEKERLLQPALEIEQLTQQVATLHKWKNEALRHQQGQSKQLSEFQKEMDDVLQYLITSTLPIAQRIAELTAGNPVSLVNTSLRQQATTLGLAFKQQVTPALDALAAKLRSSNTLANGIAIYTQYQQRSFYQVADMVGHPVLCLHPYLPTRYQATATEQAIRNLVYGFKDGVNTVQVADNMALTILRSFPAQELAETVLVIVPASTKAKNEARFKRFCELVCAKTGLVNGYNAIKPINDREAFKGQTGVNKTTNLSYDRALIAQKKILLFDDVMTTGASFKQNVQLLKQHGASQVTGLFIARTVNR